ncbi:hypothetical protein D7V93_11290 [Corallococcus llansteffanensis]|uniref:Uncharacterized protein n=2 Tax=Corallococcus llansteffanensis TaxID=2316731 RepID=A0A3A8Q2R2_9BACT|nr:hypothetical protein D7V93_11290 [Corallococcus llansteffanensis]
MGFALLGAACQPGEGTGPDGELGEESVKLRISLQGDACGVVSADATVSASDFPPIGPKALSVGNGYIEGIINNVPRGEERSVSVQAYNAAGRAVYAGASFVDVYAGSVAYTRILLKRNPYACPGTEGTGEIYIIGVLEGSTGEVDAGTVDAGSAFDAGPGPRWDAGPVLGWDAG